MRKKSPSPATLAAKANPYRYRARNLRSSMGRRAPDLPRPSTDELEAWLRAQPPHCAYTGELLDIADLHVDHMIPLDRGGSHDLSNLCLASPSANRAKGAMSASEFHLLLHLVSGWPDRGADLLKRLRMAGASFGR
ncbi:HNH endonuclease signature motif containing protein [Sphingobium sp. HT1-2]|uniref:HNH endonuclease n=1 Tax=Sphingobium sp. HT1-2 TaxID=3111640 RepID=UPI003C02ECA3